MIPCQHPLPVRKFRLFVGSLPDAAKMLVLSCPKAESSVGSGSVEVIVRELPAFKPEPFMAGQWDHRGWIYPKWSYRRDGWFNADERWSEEFWEATEPSKAIKAKAGELIAGAATDDEKLRRLYEFCRNEFANSDWVRSLEVQKKHEKQRQWRERAFGYKNGTIRAAWVDRVGDSEMIDLVFAALARGAGFPVRKTRSAERNFFDSMHEKLGRYFLNRSLVAVEVGGRWRFCSPGKRVIPYGMIAVCDEDVPMLWSGRKNADLPPRTPVAAAALSQAQRKARLRLDAAGTLDGEIEETLTGHLAITLKQRFGRDTGADNAAAAAEWVRGEVTRRLPGAELSAVEFTNLRSLDLPVTIKYRVRVPAYAEKSGGALALPPSYFEAGEPAVFPATERKYPISFPHAWSEQDDVEIALPAGFAVVDPSVPAPAGDAKVMGVSYRMEHNRATRTLRYRREFAVGGNGAISFKVEAYPTLKKFFDHLHAAEAHRILLTEVAPPARGTEVGGRASGRTGDGAVDPTICRAADAARADDEFLSSPRWPHFHARPRRLARGPAARRFGDATTTDTRATGRKPHPRISVHRASCVSASFPRRFSNMASRACGASPLRPSSFSVWWQHRPVRRRPSGRRYRKLTWRRRSRRSSRVPMSSSCCRGT